LRAPGVACGPNPAGSGLLVRWWVQGCPFRRRARSGDGEEGVQWLCVDHAMDPTYDQVVLGRQLKRAP
jgi:hypothetical protein